MLSLCYSKNASARGAAVAMPAAQATAAKAARWYLGTTDAWIGKYFKAGDLHRLDRELFGV